jgi:hypothetical protein
LIKPGAPDVSVNTSVIKEIISSNLDNTFTDNIDNNSTKIDNSTETKSGKEIKTATSNDAALIPLHHQSSRFGVWK